MPKNVCFDLQILYKFITKIVTTYKFTKIKNFLTLQNK